MAPSTPHPLRFAHDHPLVERVRSLCLRYPEAAEAVAHGRFTFRADRRQFAIVGAAHEPGGSVEFIPDDDERAPLLDRDDVWVPPYEGAYGWLAMRIEADADAAEWDLLEELLDTSYRRVALKRQLRALDAAPVVVRDV